ncbi:hypothetical protein FBU59_003299 [Linderina macrospora]|uniref:Uncharacterized protein n=1 Tax=Linderina macrospora TaxID=4868 RepID=A0ACC1J907_9FUNG|nr:hypothetical protein FBU59_003299 [Linderina macrospora]
MGIRDEKHIPDKYYCEKCRPEDHPYINSRPRTIVLAEANTIGATTMMRRSAVMAVAKMTAREEYRAAAAAAAIAASVAAAASTGGRSGSSRRASKKQVAKSETSQITASTNGRPSQPAKKGRRNRQKTHEPDEESEGEQTGNSGSNSSSDKSSGKGGKGGAKRAVGEAAGRGKRRKTSGSVSKENSATGSGNEENEGGAPTEDTVVQLPVLDTKMQRIAKQTGRGRSASSVVRSNSKSLATGSPRRGNKLAGASNGVVEENDEEEEEEKKRGQSMPGSPRSPSPSLQSLLLLENGSAAKGGLAVETGNASDGGQSTRTDRSNKRRRGGRGGASGRGGKHQRLTQSASNSPYISQGAGFGDSAPGADLGQRSRHTSPKGTPTAVAKDDGEYVNGNQGASSDDADAAAKDEEHAHHRQPKHQHPPIEMEDIDGNTITVPSNMLNTHGQPIYSSVTPETMCKIRYPHNRASLHELNRRAKQLLDWLGKAQSEYEHERLTWLRPLHAEDDEQQQQEEEEKPEVASPSALLRQQQLAGRRPSQSLSEAPTSPINPSDWPTDDPEQPREFPASDEQPSAEAMAMAVEENPAEPNRLRPTLSIMEDLVWRLIRFQETYAT